jgi:hypothetical protein
LTGLQDRATPEAVIGEGLGAGRAG